MTTTYFSDFTVGMFFGISFGLVSIVWLIFCRNESKRDYYIIGLGMLVMSVLSFCAAIMQENRRKEAERFRQAQTLILPSVGIVDTAAALPYSEPDTVLVVHVDSIIIDWNDEGDAREYFYSVDMEPINVPDNMEAILRVKEEIVLEQVDNEYFIFEDANPVN